MDFFQNWVAGPSEKLCPGYGDGRALMGLQTLDQTFDLEDTLFEIEISHFDTGIVRVAIDYSVGGIATKTMLRDYCLLDLTL